MKFDPIPLHCECGCPPIRIHNVGFSPSGQLVIHWRCLACRKTMYVVKDLELARERAMVRMSGEDAAVATTVAERDFDRRVLQSLGIRP